MGIADVDGGGNVPPLQEAEKSQQNGRQNEYLGKIYIFLFYDLKNV